MNSRALRIAAPLFVIAAGICWGVIGLFSRVLSESGFSPFQIAETRCVLVTFILGMSLLVAHRSTLRIRPNDIWMFIGTGVLSFAFFNTCYFASIVANGLSVACILLYTGPFFVVLMARLFFKERLTTKKVLALFLAFFGCVMVVGISQGGAPGGLFGVLVGLGSGFGYALYSIFSRIALRNYGSITVTFYTFLCGSIALLPFSHVDGIVTIGLTSWTLVGTMFAIALISTLLPYLLYTFALKHMQTGTASIMTFSEPLVATVISIAVFAEPFTIWSGVGILVILIALILINSSNVGSGS